MFAGSPCVDPVRALGCLVGNGFQAARRHTVTSVLVIGLTGGIASGKSTIASLLSGRGAVVLDADALGHEVYRPGLPAWRAILDTFGEDLAGPDAAIDRRKLGALVFGDPLAMRRLTGIVWPAMKTEMRRRLAELLDAGVRVVVLEAAVLLEAGWQDLVDEVWVVRVPAAVAVARLTLRNGLSEEAARARLAAQMTNDERAARADVVIDNSGSIEELSKHIDALWDGVLQRAA
jgi:dephospho-CoA kinase